MSLRRFAFHHRPTAFFVPLAGVFAAFALTPAPSYIPTILTLSTLLVYSRILFPSNHAARNSGLLWLALSVGGAIPKLEASLDALSTPGISIVVLFAMSGITSAVILGTLYIEYRISTRISSHWSQMTLLPAIWSTTWETISYMSPVGRLSAWSPVDDMSMYRWILPFAGPPALDWIVAAWAVVCYKLVDQWFAGTQDNLNIEEEQSLLVPHERNGSIPASRAPPRTYSSLLLAIFLLFLGLPSLTLESIPPPVISPDTTPITVGCIRPPLETSKHNVLTLRDYIDATNKFTSAKILLWPEGAVSFNSEAERNEGLQQVTREVRGPYVGVSFEETISNPHDKTRRSVLKRTGLAVVSNTSAKPHLVYFKRHLVPIAESFSLSHSIDPPTIYTLPLTRPKNGDGRTHWPGNSIRPVPLTASICLDFTAPEPFAALPSRPAIILAPARTWQLSVSNAMWKQARQRAEEIGGTILWCDGGESGLSGIAGGGYNEITQVGPGSWVRTIGLKNPFDERRTVYAVLGDITLIVFWVIALGGSAFRVVPGAILHGGSIGASIRGVQRLLTSWRGRRQEEISYSETDLLG